MSIVGLTYHPECFKCGKCEKSLLEGKPKPSSGGFQQKQSCKSSAGSSRSRNKVAKAYIITDEARQQEKNRNLLTKTNENSVLMREDVQLCTDCAEAEGSASESGSRKSQRSRTPVQLGGQKAKATSAAGGFSQGFNRSLETGQMSGQRTKAKPAPFSGLFGDQQDGANAKTKSKAKAKPKLNFGMAEKSINSLGASYANF